MLGAAAALAVTSLIAVPLVAVGAGQEDVEPASGWVGAATVAQDSFNGRSALAAAPEGGAYDARSTRGVDVSVRDGQLAVDDLGGRGSYRATLPEVSVRDVELRHTAVVEVQDAGRGFYESARVRVQPDRSGYSATVAHTGGALVLRIDRTSGGVTTVLARTPLAGVTPGGTLVVEVRAVGDAQVSLAARAWNSGSPEPEWQLTAADSSAEAVRSAGAVALAGYLSELGGSASVRLDDLTATQLTTGGPGTVTDHPSATPGGEPSAQPATEPSTQPTGESPGQPTTQPTVGPTTGSSTAPAEVPSVQPTTDTTAEPSTQPTTTPSTTPSTQPSSAPTAVPAGFTTGSRSAEGFVHPGIVVSADQLASVRANIAAGREPWKTAFQTVRSTSYANLGYTAAPVAVVSCPSGGSTACRRETDDATAAYTHALMWQLTGDRRYAAKAIEILDAWSGTLQSHTFDTSTYVNGKLQAAWSAQLFTKAAELVRYSDAGWSSTRVDRFESMLRKAFLPLVIDGWTGGGANWQLSMAEATMNIGVFLDDRAVFENGVADWRAQVPAAIYLTSDGAAPVVPPGTYVKASSLKSYWYQPLRYVDGLEQETCRDSGHAALGLGAALNAAETASIQGIDLYGEQRKRLTAAMELHSKYFLNPSASGWPCPSPTVPGQGAKAVFDIGYQHYAGQGASLPNTKAWLSRNRPTMVLKHITWETLTHGS